MGISVLLLIVVLFSSFHNLEASKRARKVDTIIEPNQNTPKENTNPTKKRKKKVESSTNLILVDSKPTVCFSAECAGALSERFQEANNDENIKVYIFMYGLNDGPFVEFVLNRANFVILDEGYTQNVLNPNDTIEDEENKKEFYKINMNEFYDDETQANFHHKVIIFEYPEEYNRENLLITGSYNLTNGAHNNSEDLLFIESSDLATIYKKKTFTVLEKYIKKHNNIGPMDMFAPTKEKREVLNKITNMKRTWGIN